MTAAVSAQRPAASRVQLPSAGGRPSSLPAAPSAAWGARRPSTQREQALAVARRVRAAHDAVVREVASVSHDRGRTLAANHLRCPNQTIATMRVGRLLAAIRGVGEGRLRSILARAATAVGRPLPLSEHAPICDLTVLQRGAIADELSGRAGR